MSEMSFRKAKFDDLVKLATLVNSAYRGDSSKAGWTTEADLLGGQRTDPETLREMISGNQVVLLAEKLSEQDLAGCVYLKLTESKQGYLGMLTVSPKLQAHGLGKKILQAGESFLKTEWKCKSVQMTVISIRKELIDWYLRRGYQLTDKIEKFPYGDERFGIPKRPDLHFVVLEKNL